MNVAVSRERYRICKELDYNRVKWNSVKLVLQGSFRFSEHAAAKKINAFIKNFGRTLSYKWVGTRKLTIDQGKVVSALCESLGADNVTLRNRKYIRLGPFRIGYLHRVRFRPQLKKSEMKKGTSGSYDAEVIVNILGRNILLPNFSSVLFTQFFILSLLLFFYLYATVILLYGISILYHFAENPSAMTIKATQDGQTGLALLCVLVGFTALCSRAITNVAVLAWKKIRK